MEYSPITYRRLEWYHFDPKEERYQWSSVYPLDHDQMALYRHAWRGQDLPKTDYREPRSYLSYFLE